VAAAAGLPELAPNSVILSEVHSTQSKDPEAAGPASAAGTFPTPEPHSMLGEAFERNDRTPPQQGIAPDLTARSGLSFRSAAEESASPLATPDRGIFHASDAMKGLYDMGDAPFCTDCGAQMVKNGACHRCMECGGTSGCS
jgi:ribonucleoside-diphosphate reductase alpha chain